MDIFEDIKKRLDKIDISDSERELLLKHERLTKKELEIDGEVYDAWRIIHNNSLGPGKGGIRFHPNVSEDEVKSLSFWMSLKTSLMGLPLGGAKGGVRVDVSKLDEKQLEDLSRAYAREFSDVIGKNKDIPAPDVYTNAKIMGWMMDEFEKVKGYHEPGVITGKPIELGGIALRSDATSKGGFMVLKEFIKKTGMKSGRVAVQGFGNAGSNLAKMLYEDGFSVVAVSDSKGGIYDENGLNINELIEFKKENNVSEFDGEKVSNDKILELDVDFLVLAALENQITNDNADKIKAKCILELANGPVSFDADEILHGKNVKVIPDILANAGGVVVSYFEWAQNNVGNLFEADFLSEKLNRIMVNSFLEVYELSEFKKIDMRTASYEIAIDRILKAERGRGRV